MKKTIEETRKNRVFKAAEDTISEPDQDLDFPNEHHSKKDERKQANNDPIKYALNHDVTEQISELDAVTSKSNRGHYSNVMRDYKPIGRD
ncbi:hypothetical protein B5X24_HaOG207000 [Helicoverpa armigera]|nr:hypothetical protein B5X24_HaOG207000 [Helicoverpa armigera]